MIWALLAFIIIALIALSVFYITKAVKYKSLWKDVFTSLLLQKQHHQREVDYRNKIEKNLQEQNELLQKITDGTIDNDTIIDIRSRLRSTVEKDPD